MKIGIHGKEFNKETTQVILQIFEVLTMHNVEIFVSQRFDHFLKSAAFKKYPRSVYETPCDLSFLHALISIGGDGTLLESVTHVRHAGVPILGINTGRLGFLATINKNDVEDALTKVLNGAFTLDQRALLQVDTDEKVFGDLNIALNDFTVLKKDNASMITIHTYIDGEFLNSYWADGIIVATPTGSTGYSLSCGGPLIFPRSGNFVITPVSPHNLTVRPIIVSDQSKISFEVEGRSKKFLVSLDSRFAAIGAHTRITVSKAGFKVNLIQLEGQHYFKTLRQKLNWGLDIRN